MSNMMRLSGKARAPHLWQDIEVAALLLGYQVLGLKNVLVSLSPLDIGL